MPTTSPRSIASETFLTACSPPKCLLRPLTSSNAAMPVTAARRLRGASCRPPQPRRAQPPPRRRDQAAGQEEQDQDQRAAVDHEAPLAEVAQQLGQEDEQDRAADGPVDARRAP